MFDSVLNPLLCQESELPALPWMNIMEINSTLILHSYILQILANFFENYTIGKSRQRKKTYTCKNECFQETSKHYFREKIVAKVLDIHLFMKKISSSVFNFAIAFSKITYLNSPNHNHKKRKDSLETRAELPVLHVYVENQAILETILLYRASKCKQTILWKFKYNSIKLCYNR